MLLLYTERPALIDRERETHAWMLENRPWEQFDLALVYDNAPGDWVRYSQVFHAVWDAARRLKTGFINVESDVVPTLEAFRAVLACPETVCLVPYETYTSPVAADRAAGLGPTNWGAVIEERCPGGWDAHLARGDEEWAAGGDLGFVKFGPQACARELPASTHLASNNGLLHQAVYDFLRPVSTSAPRGFVHLHWPGLRQNHRNWDDGDRAHWPEASWPEMDRLHAEYIDRR